MLLPRYCLICFSRRPSMLQNAAAMSYLALLHHVQLCSVEQVSLQLTKTSLFASVWREIASRSVRQAKIIDQIHLCDSGYFEVSFPFWIWMCDPIMCKWLFFSFAFNPFSAFHFKCQRVCCSLSNTLSLGTPPSVQSATTSRGHWWVLQWQNSFNINVCGMYNWGLGGGGRLHCEHVWIWS